LSVEVFTHRTARFVTFCSGTYSIRSIEEEIVFSLYLLIGRSYREFQVVVLYKKNRYSRGTYRNKRSLIDRNGAAQYS